MVGKIPRDHRGLYLSVPFTHGKQSKINPSSKERKESSVKEENEQVRTAQGFVFHDTNRKNDTERICKARRVL